MSVKPGFEEIAEALLGQVAVAEDLTAAREAAERNGASRTFVTRNGDLISPRGVMVGGSTDKLSGILLKKQELRAIEGRLAGLDEELEAGRNRQKGHGIGGPGP